jgi:predicted nucleic acid-binding protein
MRSRVYVETSIPSFYHEVRTEPEMVARRDWTRQFWDNAETDYELVTSVAVLDELEKGEFPNKDRVIELTNSLPLLSIEPEIVEIVESYIDRQVMPRDPSGDALHLAVASYHKCDFLLTWNCKHLANANKFERIRVVNVMLGLFVPLLVTPLELLGGSQ